LSAVTVVGLDKLNATLKALERDTGRNSKSAYVAGGKLVEGEAKRSIQERSPGNTVTRYRSGGGSYEHQASGPNEAPNTDTGRLVSSINTEITDDGVYVGTSLEYGKYLEFGTKDMEERPWLIPALNKKSDDIIKLQIGAVNKSILENEHNV
jgi:HK97 gp10 family phage protein